MVWCGVISLFPEMFRAITDFGITSRAISQNLITLQCFNPRDFAKDKHKTVDDKPYGGGPGMVFKVYPLLDALQVAKKSAPSPAKVIYLSPQGKTLNQAAVRRFVDGVHNGSHHEHCSDHSTSSFIFVAGRYEGVDERFLSHVDEEWSIGDYILSGGELPIMVLLDAIIRSLPGALGDEASKDEESFSEGLLDYPHYTRPPVVDGQAVPSVLLSGDHAAIRRWRYKEQLKRTLARRPDLLKDRPDLLQEMSHNSEDEDRVLKISEEEC